MDVQTVDPAAVGQSLGATQDQGVTAPPQAAPASSTSPSQTQPQTDTTNSGSTLAAAVAKLYNVPAGPSGEAQLSVSYKYVSQLQLVVTVFTNPQTGEEIAQFPPQELIGLAELFDQIDGVTLDRKV